ncbi:MAG TPA: hypothetical protein VKE40_25475 [Gemmataceae bacterium]|nr:hypothetical protein [Gemmataceae bacterium]
MSRSLVVVLLCLAPAVAQPPSPTFTPTIPRLDGEWGAVSYTHAGVQVPKVQLQAFKFRIEDGVVTRTTREEEAVRVEIDTRANPPRIEWNDRYGNITQGVITMTNNRITLCFNVVTNANGYLVGFPPNRFQSTQENGASLIVLERQVPGITR